TSHESTNFTPSSYYRPRGDAPASSSIRTVWSSSRVDSMAMKIHHLNLCTMCPFGGRFVSGGERSLFGAGELVIHAVLIETQRDGLVLVDTGLGLEDVRSPLRRLGPGFLAMSRPRLREDDTAARQVERLGF